MSQLLDVSYSAEPDTVHLYARGTGASASNLTGVKGKGVASIVRTGVGAHTITLSDKWNGFLGCFAAIIDATTPDDWAVTVVEELVNSSKTIKIAIFKGGTAAELTTDEKILLDIVVSRTAQTPAGY